MLPFVCDCVIHVYFLIACPVTKLLVKTAAYNASDDVALVISLSFILTTNFLTWEKKDHIIGFIVLSNNMMG